MAARDPNVPSAAAVASPRASVSSGSGGVSSSSPAPPAAGGERRKRRSSSVVVYPEIEDAGKPKLFARQSFQVSGDEEEMADTILQARQLAGERRRSVFNADNKTALEEEIALVAQGLAARRASSIKVPNAAATDATAATVDPADKDAVARRRSSVMKLPPNLRALIQQSDASGVQQKTEMPNTAATATGSSSLNNTESSATSPASHPVDGSKGWLHKVMALMVWKRVPANGTSKKPKKGEGKKVHGGRGGGRGTSGLIPSPRVAMKGRPLLEKQLSKFAGRKQLILDLDETLVHSSFKPVAGADFVMDITVDDTAYKVFVLKRPGVDQFLERVAELYEVIVFTASLPEYANRLLDLLDPKGTITSRLFREHCTFHEGYFVKDLTQLRHQSLESTIIVDNSPMAYMFQPENAIDCASWMDDRDDNELEVIADFLETIVDVPDVRDLLEFWREGAAVLDKD